jgi:hypothetical protein
MKLISHRGNLTGRFPNLENNPDYIDYAIQCGYDVEVDLRTMNGKLFLGHDAPQYQIDLNWLQNRVDKLWIHCKDKESFGVTISNNLHYFWHDTDDYTLTSLGFVWAYPGKQSVGTQCIMVMPERIWSLEEVGKLQTYGICSDFVEALKA